MHAVPVQRVLGLHVEDVELLREGRRDRALGAVVIGLHRRLRAAFEPARPARREVHALDRNRGERREPGPGLSLGAAIGVALDHQILAGALPVGAKPGLSLVPAIAHHEAARGAALVAIEVLGVDAIVSVPTQRCAEAQRALRGAVAAARRQQPALRLRRGTRDDVHDAVHRVHAPQRAARPADDLDALHVLEHHVLHVPEDARVEGCIVGGDGVDAARANVVPGRARLRDLQVGGEPQRLGQARHARAPDIVRGDDEDRSGSVGEALGFFRDRRDLEIRQLLKAEIDQLAGRREIGGCAAAGGKQQRRKQRAIRRAHCVFRITPHTLPAAVGFRRV